MTTTTKTPKTISDFTAGLESARAEPIAAKSKLEAFQSDCQQRADAPIDKVADHVRARLELAETQKALAEFEEWPIESRQLIAAENYFDEKTTLAICEALRADIETLSKAQPGFIQKQMETAAQITKRIFTAKENRHLEYQAREKAEQAAEDAESTLAAAITAVRQFELMPTEQSFHAACARVSEISFP